MTRQRRFAPFTMTDLGDHDAAISAFTMAEMRSREGALNRRKVRSRLLVTTTFQTTSPSGLAMADRLGLDVRILNPGSGRTFHPKGYLGSSAAGAHDGWRLPGFDKGFVAGFRQLVRWAESQAILTGEDVGWWTATQTIRNMYAHGNDSIVPVNYPLGVLRRTVWMLNELFPDANTLAYDRPSRAAADAAVAREHEEMRRLMKITGDADGDSE